MNTILETAHFTALQTKYWTEEEYEEFLYFIAAFPESGDLVKGAGGIRKVRWGSKGKGKRGGVRVIYFYIKPDAQVLLLDIYGKNVKETISSKELNKLLELLK